ncbi:MAG: hypothetical protein KGS72_18125 [Cyanobacteria bacterium REEB67]|nr:hypothetical protein [Cyanobacteria bacterium REEB67]
MSSSSSPTQPEQNGNPGAADSRPQSGSTVKLGDLLTGAGLLKSDDLRQAMMIAKSQGLPVGRVLIMSGYMQEGHLQGAVQAQSMLKDGLIDLETALGGLRVISKSEISLDEALSKMGYAQTSNQVTNKLGEILLESGLVDKQQLEAALAHGQTSGLPLGRVLVVTGAVSEQLLSSALNAQILIRDKRVTREQAIQSLRAAKDRQVPIEEALAETGVAMLSAESVRLGELLVMAKLLDEQKLMQAVELGLINEQPIGQVLVQNSMVSEAVLQTALQIQQLVSSGKLRKHNSGLVLELCHKENLSLEQSMERVQPPAAAQPASNTSNIPLYQFLQLAGVIGAKDIEDALKVGSRDSNLMGQMLLLTGAIDNDLLTVALKCSDLLRQGVLKTEQAVIALGICAKSHVSVDEAFRQLGWSQTLLTNPSFSPVQTLVLPAQTAPQAATPEQPAAQPAPTKATQTAFHLPAMVAPQLSTGNTSPTATDMEMTMPPGAEKPLADNKPTSTGESEVIKKDGEGKEGKPSSAKKRLADLIP